LDRIRYLGIYFVTNKQFSIDISWICRKFYTAAIAILYRTRFASEMTRLCLFESFTLPLLTYGCEGIDMSVADMQKLNACWNNVYRSVWHEFVGIG